jgi:DNA-binding transcriptional MerR regulator
MKILGDILKETGLSYHTLVKYTGVGLLPKPQRIWRGRKGSKSLYPDGVIDIINHIKSEQESGLTLRQIAENWRVQRATDVFTAVISMYPEYDFTRARGDITKTNEQPDGSVIVEVKLVGEKRR